MSFFEVLNLKVYWNEESSTEPFINTAIPIHDSSAKVIDIIRDEVLRVDSTIKRYDIDCDRDIISAKSSSNKDISRLLNYPISLMLKQIINETPIEISVIIDAAFTIRDDSVNIGDTTQAIYDKNDNTSSLDDMGMEKTNNLVTVQVAADDDEDLANIGDTNQAICDSVDDYRAMHLDDVGMEKNKNLVTVPPNNTSTTRKKGKEKTASKILSLERSYSILLTRIINNMKFCASFTC